MLICLYCKKEFPRGRKLAQFCSQRCRIYSRRKKEVTSDICTTCGKGKDVVMSIEEYKAELNTVVMMYEERIKELQGVRKVPEPVKESEITYD